MWRSAVLPDPLSVFQQAQEMVQEILRDRDQGGYSERSEFSSRMGGGMDVSLCVGARLEVTAEGF